MQSVGIIINVDNPILVSTIKKTISSLDGVKIIYVTIRNDKKLYIVDQEGMQQ